MRVRDFVRVMCVVRVRSSGHANVTCGAMCVRACMYERMSGRAWMQVDETHAQYLFVQYEDGWSAVGYQLICGRHDIYVCGRVRTGVGAYRFVRAMCIVMGVKQWVDG